MGEGALAPCLCSPHILLHWCALLLPDTLRHSRAQINKEIESRKASTDSVLLIKEIEPCKVQTSLSLGLCSCSHWSQAMGPGAEGTSAPFSGVRGRRGVVNRGSCCRWGRGILTQEYGLADRHRVSKSSHAESLMALGVIAGVRGRGVLESAQVGQRRY